MSKVVIGSGFGDESKGNITNFLCSQFQNYETVLNVRFSGGSQAGHTVVFNGKRHVFHHFGAGSFNPNVSTFLSQDFIVNPIIFEQELNELNEKGVFPHVYIDVEAKMTTPYDMMLNQMVEESRGANRHGSCGLGINETIKRHESDFLDKYWLNAGWLVDDDHWIYEFLASVRDEWVPYRMEQLGLKFGENVSADWKQRFASNNIIENYVKTIQTLRYNCHVINDPENLLNRYQDRIVFEGSQGLLLDANHKFFPHVTNANTGLKNVLRISKEARISTLDVIYVTRCYSTRHGAGPFPHEVPGLSYPDPTNVPNDWQGTLRFGILDLDLMRDTIAEDLANAVSLPIKVNPVLAVTCLDQIRENIPYVRNGELQNAKNTTDFLSAVRDHVGLRVEYASFGVNRWDIACAWI